MFGILRFFAIVFLVVFLLGIVSRFLLRIFFKRMANRYNNFAQQQPTRPEGEVYVSKPSGGEKKVDKNVGDYIDYEDVK